MAEPPPDRLDSWKEIAAYLKRGVRTVRRWEHDEGLPVHRHLHRTLGSVYAYRSEIDEWQRSARRRPEAQRPAVAARGEPQASAALSPGLSPEHLARLIAEALKGHLAAGGTSRLSERPIANLHAYECSLRARQDSWRWRKDAIDDAVRQLRNGLTIIGDNIALHAALGLAHLQYREAGIDLGDGPLEAAEACARKVMALDPSSALGFQLSGWIQYARGSIQAAVRDLRVALELDPHNADTLLQLSNCYLISGRVPAARPLIERLMSIDPLTPLTHCMPAFADLLEGRAHAAVEPYRQMFEMDPGNPMARLFYVWVLVHDHRGDEAAAVVETWPPELRATVPSRVAVFLAQAQAGNAADAVAALTPDVEAAARTTDMFARMLAHGYALVGDRDRATAWLAVAVDRGFINYPFLTAPEPYFARLADHPPFARLVEQVRGRWERFEA